MSWEVADMIDQMTDFNKDLADAMASISNMPYDNTMIWSVIEGVYNFLLPWGYTFLGLFFMLGFLKKTMMFEFMNWENVVKILLRFVVAKIVLENGLEVIKGIAQVVNAFTQLPAYSDLLDAVADPPSGSDAVMGLDGAAMKAEYESLNFFDRIWFHIVCIPIYLVTLVLKLIVFVVIYGRFIEICLYALISPIPMSTMVAEEFSGVAKKFFQGYIAVLFQGLLIIGILYLYTAFTSSFMVPKYGGSEAGLHIYLLSIIVLAMMLTKSGNWARQIMGG
jgi:hypothetical protein